MLCDRVETFSQIRGASKVGKREILIGDSNPRWHYRQTTNIANAFVINLSDELSGQ